LLPLLVSPLQLPFKVKTAVQVTDVILKTDNAVTKTNFTQLDTNTTTLKIEMKDASVTKLINKEERLSSSTSMINVL
jgi:hypothetical protein